MFDLFKKKNVIAVISGKEDGPMSLEEKRREFLSKTNIDPGNLVRAVQVHGNSVKIISSVHSDIAPCDGLVTAEKEVFISITVGDCLPVFLLDPGWGVIGLIHAGWRGLTEKIITNAIGVFTEIFSCRPEDILAGIGPGICGDHFEVRESVALRFNQKFLKIKEEKFFIDLKEAARDELAKSGIRKIEISPDCTFCMKDKYFSFRRDKPEKAETMIAIMGIKK